jgi:hypothetical protein
MEILPVAAADSGIIAMLAVGISARHGLVDKSLQAGSNTVDMMDNASALPELGRFV